MPSSSRLVWLHYGVPSPKWDAKILESLQKVEGLEILMLNAKEMTFEDLGTALLPEFDLLVNRVSDAQSPELVKFVLSALNYCENVLGTQSLNGLRSYGIGCSKALQGHVLDKLLLEQPKTRVVRRPGGIVGLRKAAAEIGYPLMIKPNAGGFGDGILKFTTEEELEKQLGGAEAFADDKLAEAAADKAFGQTNDGVLLVQRYHDAAEFCRVWHLGTKILVAAKVITKAQVAGEEFNSCASSPTKTFVVFQPDSALCDEVARIKAACGCEMGSVEYLEEDGKRLYFDINMLSTLPFESNLEFDSEETKQAFSDPHAKAAEYIAQEAAKCAAERRSGK